MFFLNKKRGIKAVASGNLLPIERVEDYVFSSRLIGNGFAIVNHNGEIFSPLDGIVFSIFPTKHAITLKNDKNETVLIHMGIDTVDLKGKGFELYIGENQQVKAGDHIAKMNIPFLLENKKDTVVIVVTPDNQGGKIHNKKKEVTPNDIVFIL